MFAAESWTLNSATWPGPTEDFDGSVTLRATDAGRVELIHELVANELAEYVARCTFPPTAHGAVPVLVIRTVMVLDSPAYIVTAEGTLWVAPRQYSGVNQFPCKPFERPGHAKASMKP